MLRGAEWLPAGRLREGQYQRFGLCFSLLLSERQGDRAY
jgi:hypothetical protein